jgi:hypothetical protein
MLFDHHAMICFVSNPGHRSYYGQEPKFAAALQESLTAILRILEQQSGRPADPRQPGVEQEDPARGILLT